jgi:hypothetical protein
MTRKPNLTLLNRTLTINRPVKEVFDFVSNHENYANWYPGVVSVRSSTDLPHGVVGKRYEEILRMPTGRNQKIPIRVVEAKSPTSFVTEGEFSPLHPRMSFSLSADSTATTQIHWMFESRSQSLFGRFIVNKLFRPIMSKQSNVAAERLKSILETPESTE